MRWWLAVPLLLAACGDDGKHGTMDGPMRDMADDIMVGSWFFASYAWNQAQDATTEATPTGMMNANGTQHDIPSRAQCRRCHENTPGRVLGFQAMSLDYQNPTTSELDLDDLVN